MRRRERVLQALEDALKMGRVANEACPEGWVNGHVLCLPGIGGSEGLRRLRELRQSGHMIEMRMHPEKGRATRQYRLVK